MAELTNGVQTDSVQRASETSTNSAYVDIPSIYEESAGVTAVSSHQAAAQVAEHSHMHVFWSQCCTVVYHVWLLKRANKKSTAAEVILPILAVGIVFLIQYMETPDLTTAAEHLPPQSKSNGSHVYSYSPVELRNTNGGSYLSVGHFMPVSRLLVAPNTDATIKLARNVFQCVLQLAGYTQNDVKPDEWSRSDLKVSESTLVAFPNGSSSSVTHHFTTSYSISGLTNGFADAEGAVNAINAPEYPNDYGWNNQAPVALVFDDVLTKPSYEMHFRQAASYTKILASGRLPEATPDNGGCPLPPYGKLPREQSQIDCYASYSDCVDGSAAADESNTCAVAYDQSNFIAPSEHLCVSDQYIYAGVAVLQLCIDTELTRLHAKNPNILDPLVSLQMMPRRPRDVEPSETNINAKTFFLMIGCGGITTIFVVWLVMLEKERKLKQLLHMIGVSPAAYWVGWLLGSLSIWLVIGFILWFLLFVVPISPLNKTDGAMLLVILMMAGVNAIFMAFVFVTLFNKAVMAVMFTVTYIFAIALIYVVLQVYVYARGCVGKNTYWGLSLLGNFALLSALGRMLFLNSFKASTTWADFGSASGNQISIAEAFAMQIVDTIIYALLGFYFDQVMPNEHGVRRHPLFLLKISFWKSLFTSTTHGTDDLEECEDVTRQVLQEWEANPDVESVVEQAKHRVGIITHKLCKDFNKQWLTTETTTSKRLAVDGVSLMVHTNEITAILGHNGAGKTTLIRMLTGQTAPTSGKAFILGHSIHNRNNENGLRAVQATLGMATQDNVLWPTLTVKEHLQIFGRLKNMTKNDINASSEELLLQLDLLDKLNARSGKLSGGQQRRLCLALALIGRPKIVFLDEPSCGVDPQSRRKIWDVLNSYKAADRCIVMTTHSMYEADVLADRKIIISKGKLRCAGTSIFLKNRFGVGYKLNIEFNSQLTSASERQQHIASLTKQMTDIFSLSSIIAFGSSLGGEFKFLEAQLPKHEVNRFPQLFALLESGDVLKTMSIVDVGFSMVSLEEVFLELSKKDDPPLTAAENSESSAVDDVSSSQIQATYWKKFAAILRIRFKLWRRRPLRYAFTIVITVLPIFVAAYFETLIRYAYTYAVKANAANAAKSSTTPVDIGYYQTLLLNSASDPLLIRAHDTSYDNLVSYGESQRATYYAGADIKAWPSAAAADISTRAQYTVWYNGSFVHSVPMALNALTSMYYKTMTGRADTGGISVKIFQKSIRTSLFNQSYDTMATAGGSIIPFAFLSIVPLMYTLALCFFTSTFVVDAVYDKQTGAIRMLRLSNASGSLYWLPMFVAHVVTHALPVALAFIVLCSVWTSSFISYTGLSAVAFALHNALFVLVMMLLAYCASLLFRKISSALTANMIFSICFGIGMAIAAGMTLMRPMQCRANNACDMRGDKQTEVFVILSILVPWWSYAGGIAALLFNYFGQNSASPWTTPFYLTTFAGLLIWVVAAFAVLSISELVCSGMAKSFLARTVLRAWTMNSMKKQLELDGVDGLFQQPPGAARHSHEEDDEILKIEEDDDVRAERLLSSEASTLLVEQFVALPGQQNDAEMPLTPLAHNIPAITVLHVRKKYSSLVKVLLDTFTELFTELKITYLNKSVKTAVDNVSFRVQPSEIFGLLGPNGAGKTTIVAMIVNEISPTAGLIHVGRYNALLQRSEATSLLGYCPQFDALWDEITLSEHLELMAALHGQQANMKPPHGAILRMAEKLGLAEHWNKKVCTLSGGTKRKLSFLLSIIDQNMTTLLDEPSSGMDPGSARYLWDIIKHHFKNRPITTGSAAAGGGILTTHYMEEAEALCDRIAIMVKGNIRCIGTPTHLRNKFGSGFRLELRLINEQEETRDSVASAVKTQYSEAIMKEQESRLNRLVFSLPQHQALPLSRSFAFLESLRIPSSAHGMHPASTTEFGEEKLDKFGARAKADNNKVVEYTISQASIEHVFLRIAGE